MYDVIIIGGGHAGTEAALAAARAGVCTLLLTHRLDRLGEMSCNPAIGGIGKSHLVKEIDALGGAMAHAADLAGIQFRVLNASKGPAVRATRAQTDRELYKKTIQAILFSQKNLNILEDAVDELIIENDSVKGVVTASGEKILSATVVLAAGTFLNGRIYIGKETQPGGRIGDRPSLKLAKFLRKLPLHVSRLKTGTPPRIAKNSIDYDKLKVQAGDSPLPVFSFLGNIDEHPEQICCHIAHTTEKTHEIIRNNLDKSAMYGGMIKSVGPRYCPSIEDKIVRFADRTSHQVFVEPEGLTSDVIYPNGISTSLPEDVQIEFVRSMSGFENARIMRAGYAIEYDFFDPRDLKLSLEAKAINNLFFAGQINGTTGYEEAAAQGLIAGLNAARKAQNKDVWTPCREEAYIGVMIDDLITKGTKEPYRMFTSRAEYRLMLREDNADLRLTEKGYELGLVDAHRWKVFTEKREQIEIEQKRLKTTWVQPESKIAQAIHQQFGQALSHEYSLMDLLTRHEINYGALKQITEAGIDHIQAIEQIEIQAKYAGYIKRQQAEIERRLRHEHLKIPNDFDYNSIKSLSHETKQKLSEARPETLGVASRLSGITPAAISVLLIHLKR